MGTEEEKTEDTAQDNETSRAGIIAALLFYAIIGLIIAFNNDASREFIERNRNPLILVGVLAATLVAIVLAVQKIRGKLKVESPGFKAAAIIFTSAPLLLLIVGAVGYLPARFQVTGLRVVFLAIVCILPPTLWYLFIATRKWSVLNDYLANLECLGLLKPRQDWEGNQEDDDSFKRRFYNYLDKFEAVYGPLQGNARDNIVSKGFLDPSMSTEELGSRSVLSTTAIPVLLSTALFVLGWIITLPPVPDYAAELLKGTEPADRWVTALGPSETAVNFAFLGAYFFGIQLLFRRYVRNDLAGAAYVKVVMRVILAVIIAWTAGAALEGLNRQVTNTQMLVVGFVVGVFPSVGVDLIKKAFRTITGLRVSTDTQLPLGKLDGMSIFHETRLDEEDIENVSNMASADIVELLLKTRFSVERIVDWVDQSTLLTQLGRGKVGRQARETMTAHGIRSASSFLAAAEGSKGNAAFLQILDPPTRMPALLAAVRTSPNIDLVLTWKSHSDPVIDGLLEHARTSEPEEARKDSISLIEKEAAGT